MIKLWRCEICGDPYIGEEPPANCPFCGTHRRYIKEAKDAKAEFDLKLNEKDRSNVLKALDVEISNAHFYFCAAESTENDEGKLLFRALGKVEKEHASIWKKILKISEDIPKIEKCSKTNKENLEESHKRETNAIKFYAEAAKESENKRIRIIFEALVEVETDHLRLSEERLK